MPTDKGYVAPPSIGHELGVMFGFIGFMVVSFILYAVVFSMYNKRWEQKEHDRLAALRAAGYGPVDENKKLQQPASEKPVVEHHEPTTTTASGDGAAIANGR